MCAAGKWCRGTWVNGAGRPELERKFGTWVDNLSRCIECDDDAEGSGGDADGDADGDGNGGGGGDGGGSSVRVEQHAVQPKWFLNSFIFASRQWSREPPRSSSAAAGGSQQGQGSQPGQGSGGVAGGPAAGGPSAGMPNMSNSSHVSASKKLQVVAEWKATVRHEKRLRRLAKRTEEQRACAERMHVEREARALRVVVEPLGRARLCVHCVLEVHHGTFIELA